LKKKIHSKTNNKHKNNKLQRSFSITNKFNPEQRNTHKRKASFIVGGLSNNNNVTSKTQNTTRNTQNTNYLLKKKKHKKTGLSFAPNFFHTSFKPQNTYVKRESVGGNGSGERVKLKMG
jgi:hypothetical protein